MPRKVNSAGFVIRSMHKDGQWRYLLCHASGGGMTKGWGIPKGKQDQGFEDEPLLSVALREVREETNLDLIKVQDGETTGHIYFVYTLKDKIVSAYTFSDPTGQLLNYAFSCPSEYSPGKPEIDDYKWVTIDKAVKMATESQKGLFRHIQEHGF